MEIVFNWDLILNAFTMRFVEELKLAAPKFDGELAKSITGKVIGKKVEITATSYALALEFGSKSHMPPVEPLKKWTRERWGKEDPWRLAMHIKYHGTKPNPFIQKTIKEKAANCLADALRIKGAIEVWR